MFFKAGGEQTREGPNPVLEVDGNVLKSTGFIFGTILNLGEPEDEAARGRPSNLARIVTMVGEVLETPNKRNRYPTGEEILSVANIILEADQPRMRNSSSITSLYENNIAQDILLEIQTEELEEGRRSLPDRVTEEMAEYFKAADRYELRNIARAIAGRRLAVITKAYAGLVPTAAQRGDKIVVLKGFSVPFVMRRTSAGRFVLVGDCYIHGIMQGEALSAGKPPVMRNIEIH